MPLGADRVFKREAGGIAARPGSTFDKAGADWIGNQRANRCPISRLGGWLLG
jgi:hypothetical protein